MQRELMYHLVQSDKDITVISPRATPPRCHSVQTATRTQIPHITTLAPLQRSIHCLFAMEAPPLHSQSPARVIPPDLEHRPSPEPEEEEEDAGEAVADQEGMFACIPILSSPQLR